eukprot:TRINITY_DN4361_c0_g4_i2.p1 TRINITY_DN4361_c0_g4~~TRINITY_DN4361_c0_g4_i2.p1  ORF type:complete len:284 (+),score=89.65 TRINITY_DN4361_c0_g4_i2:128-979(+)
MALIVCGMEPTPVAEVAKLAKLAQDCIGSTDPLDALASEGASSDDTPSSPDSHPAGSESEHSDDDCAALSEGPASPPRARDCQDTAGLRACPSQEPFLPSDVSSQSSGSEDCFGHPLGEDELRRQRQMLDAERMAALDEWCQERRGEQHAYFMRVGVIRSLVLVNEAQRRDLSDLRDKFQRRSTAKLFDPLEDHELRMRAQCFRGQWSGVAQTLVNTQRCAGPEAVLRGLSAMRLFVPGKLTTAPGPDAHELARRQRAVDILQTLREQDKLFLPAAAASASQD